MYVSVPPPTSSPNSSQNHSSFLMFPTSCPFWIFFLNNP